ncbi:MAG: hypothetical protein IT162_08340 [Bryobacterales bacterium]|nr:hypothetical protein [Bryobacterales bacterium]
MNACPVCQVSWPAPAAVTVCAVCPACYSTFDRNSAGKIWQVPPFPSAARPLPLALGSPLEVAGHRYRLAGFAEWSYEVEHYRDTFETIYRREFTLVNEAGGALAVLGSDEDVWWLVREVPAHTIDRAHYTQSRRQYYTVMQAAGQLWQRFRWTAPYQPIDHVAGPRGPGGEILLGDLSAQSATVWVGRFLPYAELPVELRPDTPPPPARPVASMATLPAPVTPQPNRPGWLRGVALVIVAAGTLAAIAAFAYYRDRYTRPVSKTWVDCPTPVAKTRVPVPAEAGRVQLDAHLTTGAIPYRLRFLTPRGTVGGENVSALLDLNPRHREPIHTIHPGASELEMECSMPIPVEGRRQWLVELRFLR